MMLQCLSYKCLESKTAPSAVLFFLCFLFFSLCESLLTFKCLYFLQKRKNSIVTFHVGIDLSACAQLNEEIKNHFLHVLSRPYLVAALTTA